MNAVLFENVSKRFQGRDVVRDLQLAVPRGAIYGLLGPNGAGKTTSIRMLMSILRPDAGRVLLFGEPASPALKDRIGYMPEERGLYRPMRVIDNLVYFGSLHGLSRDEARRRAASWLKRLAMSKSAALRLQELSKGNQQRIQFIATVLHEPELLVLDEPFSGLDPVNQEEMRASLVALAAAGATIILSTHGMDDVERLCSHITLLHDGRAVLNGSLDDVRRRHGGDVVRLEARGDSAFLATLPGVAAAARNGGTIELRLDGTREAAALLADIAPRLAVHRFEVQSASLHSIFVRLVRGEAAAAPETAAPESAALESAALDTAAPLPRASA